MLLGKGLDGAGMGRQGSACHRHNIHLPAGPHRSALLALALLPARCGRLAISLLHPEDGHQGLSHVTSMLEVGIHQGQRSHDGFPLARIEHQLPVKEDGGLDGLAAHELELGGVMTPDGCPELVQRNLSRLAGERVPHPLDSGLTEHFLKLGSSCLLCDDLRVNGGLREVGATVGDTEGSGWHLEAGRAGVVGVGGQDSSHSYDYLSSPLKVLNSDESNLTEPKRG